MTTGRQNLIAANAVLWAGEAELIRTYFASSERTLATDLAWIARQAAKELVDGVLARADSPVVVAEEREHLAAFLAAHDRLRPGSVPSLRATDLHHDADWPANAALRELRRRHRHQHGRIGTLAGLITEGGAAVLFREGASLVGNGGRDDVIAMACGAVLADEVRHALDAIDDLAASNPGPRGWATAIECTVEQSRQRLHMRAEQFGHPVPPARFAELLAGRADPTPVLFALDPEHVVGPIRRSDDVGH